MVIVNRINCPELALVRNITASKGEVLVEKLKLRRTAINETQPASGIWREAAQRIAGRYRGQTAPGKIPLRGKADSFETGAKVSAPEIFNVDTAAEHIIAAKQFVLTDLADIDMLIKVGDLRLMPVKGWIRFRTEWSSPDAGQERVLIRHIELAGRAAKGVGAPNTQVPLVTTLKIAHRRCRLHHFFFFAGSSLRTVGVNSRRHYKECE